MEQDFYCFAVTEVGRFPARGVRQRQRTIATVVAYCVAPRATLPRSHAVKAHAPDCRHALYTPAFTRYNHVAEIWSGQSQCSCVLPTALVHPSLKSNTVLIT